MPVIAGLPRRATLAKTSAFDGPPDGVAAAGRAASPRAGPGTALARLLGLTLSILCVSAAAVRGSSVWPLPVPALVIALPVTTSLHDFLAVCTGDVAAAGAGVGRPP